MFPPLNDTLQAAAGVTAIFGSNPMRVWAFDDAPAPGTTGYALPYAVWQTVSGSPDNYLAGVPDMDGFTTQITVFANLGKDARNGAKSIRDAIEPVAYVAGWRGEGTEPDTKLKFYRFDVDWMTPRT